MTPPPPLPFAASPAHKPVWAYVRSIVQLLLLAPSTVVAIPIFIVSVVGLIAAGEGNPRSGALLAMTIPYCLGILFVLASVFVPRTVRRRWLVALLPSAGILLFALSLAALHRTSRDAQGYEVKWSGPAGSRGTVEQMVLFGGPIAVAAWNLFRLAKPPSRDAQIA